MRHTGENRQLLLFGGGGGRHWRDGAEGEREKERMTTSGSINHTSQTKCKNKSWCANAGAARGCWSDTAIVSDAWHVYVHERCAPSWRASRPALSNVIGGLHHAAPPIHAIRSSCWCCYCYGCCYHDRSHSQLQGRIQQQDQSASEEVEEATKMTIANKGMTQR